MKEHIPQDERDRRLKVSMGNLVMNPHFTEFMSWVSDMKDMAIRDAINDGVLGNASTRLAALGAVRTYLDLLDAYENVLAYPVDISVDGDKLS